MAKGHCRNPVEKEKTFSSRMVIMQVGFVLV